MDAFDALRDADAARQSWIEAARIFTRYMDRVVDKPTVQWLERLWAEEAAKPLAPVEKAWDLVSMARDAICENLPLTFEEAERWDDLTTAMVIEETRRWQDARRQRDQEVEEEVERELARVPQRHPRKEPWTTT